MSAAAAAINQDKGATLEQISRTVQDINTAIQARKAQLAPQVKELRAARQAAQVLLCLPSPTVGSPCCAIQHFLQCWKDRLASRPSSSPCPPRILPCVHAAHALLVGMYTPVSMQCTQLGPGNSGKPERPQLTCTAQLLPALHLLCSIHLFSNHPSPGCCRTWKCSMLRRRRPMKWPWLAAATGQLPWSRKWLP